ncbi:hypothetical protein PENSPDRAFT_657394 [Peniophora sp. CONT]|nr:hypothetical protein PENSPDRAFT_657394 [Peniophora sp. CONT]
MAEPAVSPEQMLYLSLAERAWMYMYNDLLSQGYRLRARYQPNWKPSWIQRGTTLEYIHENHLEGEYEDCLPLSELSEQAIDATRVVDGKQVWLKYVTLRYMEHSIMQTTSSDAHCNDPCNHCVPLLDVLYTPQCEQGDCIVVMPMCREWYDPALHVVGEAMDFISQLLQGLAFIHQLNITHGDIKSTNIMMLADTMFPNGFNPLVVGRNNRAYTLQDAVPRGSRVDRPVKYVYIDFGHGRRFDSIATRHKVEWTGGYDLLPEIQECGTEPGAASSQRLFDPFQADVYSLGFFIFDFFIRDTPSLIPAIIPLVLEMCQRDPLKRPTAEQCVRQFHDVATSMSWSLCYRLPPLRLFTWEASLDERRDVERREARDYIGRLIRFLHVNHGQPRLLRQ